MTPGELCSNVTVPVFYATEEKPDLLQRYGGPSHEEVPPRIHSSQIPCLDSLLIWFSPAYFLATS